MASTKRCWAQRRFPQAHAFGRVAKTARLGGSACGFFAWRCSGLGMLLAMASNLKA